MEFSLNLRWPIVLNASSELLHESDWDSHCFSRFLRGCWWLQVSLERIRTGTIVAPPSRRFQRGMVELQGDTYTGVLSLTWSNRVIRMEHSIASVKIPVKQSGNIMRSSRILIIPVWKKMELSQSSANSVKPRNHHTESH